MRSRAVLIELIGGLASEPIRSSLSTPSTATSPGHARPSDRATASAARAMRSFEPITASGNGPPRKRRDRAAGVRIVSTRASRTLAAAGLEAALSQIRKLPTIGPVKD